MEELKQLRSEAVQSYINNQRDLMRQQRKYKKIINTRFFKRKEAIFRQGTLANIEHLKLEKDDVRAQIYAATGKTHLRENEHRLRQIRCHVVCQENLNGDIKELKSHIQLLTLQIKSVEKKIYDLNRTTIPENQNRAHVLEVRRTKENLENQLNVFVQRVCKYSASNATLRGEVVKMITSREFFHDLYNKMILQLDVGNRYLIDLIEYAQNTFENCTNIYEKINVLHKKSRHDLELRKIEMLAAARRTAQDNENFDFYIQKDKKRDLADLEPREYKRRAIFRKNYTRKNNLYDELLQKILKHSNTPRIETVIENFQDQESLYYSYFSYANEKNYHLTMLNTYLSDLYQQIDTYRDDNKNALDHQTELILELEKELEEHRKAKQEIIEQKRASDRTLQQYFREIHAIFGNCKANRKPLQNLLGDHSKVTVMNVKLFLQLLEKRVNHLVARVYITQKRDPKTKPSHYVVRNITKRVGTPTQLNDVVLTQQCPECAEGEVVHTDGTEVVIATLEEIRKQLHEKVTQPEMQYRLHSLSECRLERSRMLANSKIKEK